MKKINLRYIGFLLLFSTILIFGFVACNNSSSNPTSPQPANEIWMQNTQFVPNSITVAKGATLVFVNKDQMNHTVTSGVPGNPDGGFDYTVAPGQSVSITFNTVGTIKYFCKIHQPNMTGTITVQ